MCLILSIVIHICNEIRVLQNSTHFYYERCILFSVSFIKNKNTSCDLLDWFHSLLMGCDFLFEKHWPSQSN